MTFLVDFNIDKQRVEVFFKYNPEYVALIKTLSNRRWVPDDKIWVIGLSDVEMLIEIADKNGIRVILGDNYLSTFKKNENTLINTWETKLELHKYQKEGATKLYYNKNFAIFDDTGLGKTAQCIAVISKLYLESDSNKDFKVLIICPSSLMKQWQEEFKKFSYIDEKYITLIKGTKLKRQQLWSENSMIKIMNYDLIRFDNEPLEQEWDLIILDEATRIKNLTAKTTQQINKLKANRKIVATATPIENNVKELYSIFNFLNPDLLGKFYNFKQEYFVEELMEAYGRTFNQLVGYKNLDKLKRIIAPFYIRRIKDEVMSELPSIINENIYIDLSTSEKTIYNHIEKLIEDQKQPENMVDGSGIIGLYQLQRVLCNGEYCFKYSQSTNPDIMALQMKATEKSTKVNECSILINQILLNNPNDKILVFSDFTIPFELLKQKLVDLKIGYSELFGDVKKEEQIKEFKENPNIKVFLIQTKTGGAGLNLQEANHVIFLNKPFNPATEYQALSRSHRQGQTKTVFIYNFIVEDGIEEKIIDILKKKKDLSLKVIEKDIYKTSEVVQ